VNPVRLKNNQDTRQSAVDGRSDAMMLRIIIIHCRYTWNTPNDEKHDAARNISGTIDNL
jgi:hypothetical protein